MSIRAASNPEPRRGSRELIGIKPPAAPAGHPGANDTQPLRGRAWGFGNTDFPASPAANDMHCLRNGILEGAE